MGDLRTAHDRRKAPRGLAIPVDIEILYSCRPSDAVMSNHCVLWRLGVRAGRHPAMAAGLSLLAAMFGGVGFAPAPVFFRAIFGAVGLAMALWSRVLWLRTTRVCVDPTGIRVRRSVLGIGRARRIDASDVGGIEAVIGMQSNHRAYYDIRVSARQRAIGRGVARRPRSINARGALPVRRSRRPARARRVPR